MLQKGTIYGLLIFMLLCSGFRLTAQDCRIVLSGRVIDEHDNSSLSYAGIYLEEARRGAQADSSGSFLIEGLCPGTYHLSVSHLQCETKRMRVELVRDTSITLYLEHHAELLSTVTVEASRPDPVLPQPVQVIGQQALDRFAGRTLGDAVEQTIGVTTIKTGPAIVKPVIHGLYGTRLVVVNNGLVQEGQNWGNEHAPEVDPFSTNKISVVKGTAAVKYGSEAMGGAIVLEPAALEKDHHTHGALQFTGASNSGLMALAGELTGALPLVDDWYFRVQGNVKMAGDANTPDYRLSNTGLREQAFSLQTTGDLGPLDTRFYYSFFNTELGILRGSHIGNLSDLEEALMRDEPFFTEPFSYQINNPRQRVSHHLAKASTRLLTEQGGSFELTYGFQLNQRKEYDIRRGGRSDIPALDMDLQTHAVNIEWDHPLLSDRIKGEIGIEWQMQKNRNDAETGVSPLIPWYNEQAFGAYVLEHFILNRSKFELGFRYTYKRLLVKTFDAQNELIEPEHTFHNLAASAGWNFDIHPNWTFRTHLGYSRRNPNISELYSDGLHHGAAAIEEGDPNLNSESGLKWTTGLTWQGREHWYAEVNTYVHQFSDYIMLEPQDELVLTIRGAFPLFRYVQQDARIWGIDAAGVIELWEGMHWEPSYSLIRSKNLEEDIPLFFIPSDRFKNRLHAHWDKWGKILEPEVALSGTYVWEQTRAPESGDFAPPPPGYFLLDLEIGARWIIRDNELKTTLSIQNMTNTRYRDYLNRLRYFADDTGINVEMRIKYSF